MKKFLLSMAAGAMALTATAAPVFAAESTGKTNVGYSDGAITDPDNPTNPEFSVSIPKDFMFVKDAHETQNMDVKLTIIKDAEFGTKTVHVDVSSAEGYKLKNASNTTVGELDYNLTYGSKTNTNGEIGILSKADSTISGTATLPHDQLTQVGVDGTYTDTLTYTVHSAI